MRPSPSLGANIIAVSTADRRREEVEHVRSLSGHCGKSHRVNSHLFITWRVAGKVLCKDCTSKTVYTGPNQRPSRVCDVCYTLLVRDSQPYFLSGSTSL